MTVVHTGSHIYGTFIVNARARQLLEQKGDEEEHVVDDRDKQLMDLMDNDDDDSDEYYVACDRDMRLLAELGNPDNENEFVNDDEDSDEYYVACDRDMKLLAELGNADEDDEDLDKYVPNNEDQFILDRLCDEEDPKFDGLLAHGWHLREIVGLSDEALTFLLNLPVNPPTLRKLIDELAFLPEKNDPDTPTHLISDSTQLGTGNMDRNQIALCQTPARNCTNCGQYYDGYDLPMNKCSFVGEWLSNGLVLKR
ncbi:expressed unknown protein [Seminavis robusta]|uniref:Uncharacterized protein n=1 Tax=Seminavis robusta TaxID=568900 RepID=A0A9N8DJG5_9STRA|nr:expressed unknown protein [Seminavis robusta]|eukprot:Sro155_g070540.1 n/a (253) ;mRNA; f:94338-95096